MDKNNNAYSCNKESEISRISTIVDILDHEINGNGQPGLSKTVPQLVMVTTQLSKDVSALSTVVSALAKFQTESETKERTIKDLKDENIIAKRDKKWLIGSIITVLLTLIVILVGTNVTQYNRDQTNPRVNSTYHQPQDTLVNRN